MTRVFLKWLPFAIAVTGLSALLYGAVQQNFRQSLNDPQVQMAEDGAHILARGGFPADIVPRAPLINADESLSPFVAVFDSSGTPLEASATIGGMPPKPPLGVLLDAKNNMGKDTTSPGQNRVTWQPSPQTRIALVIQYVPEKQQYVAAGRNMREVENREVRLAQEAAIAWIVCLLGTLLAVAFLEFSRKRAL